MYFLIDLENVKNSGMRGAEHLLPEDHIEVFYSENTHKMEARYLKAIEQTQCDLVACKLPPRITPVPYTPTPKPSPVPYYPIVTPAPAYVRGDYDGDGVLTVMDAVGILQYLSRG